ncbi:hypothetical protein BB987_13080 [Photorhabdus temperata]|uniref:MoxR-like ATPase n=2 Tax=Photorhabdus khanii TaxID=1004150 RepID=W3V5U9_9GAMM|nr:AAA family ATPase [Photorhabdus khanii]ETS31321.1 MoxR-like ATPase [Photorhabdus khanii NC19]MQL50256.1 AAA family ATPase [Photorhabdus khanii]OHV53069.1 hypothetical protein BB987_13080 [Photorhabdus temperata]
MQTNERKVLCTIEKGYSYEREDQLGKLRVYFEILSNGEIVPINKESLFCETEQVFVTSGYSELREKYSSSLFAATCVPTNFEKKEGNCQYITRANFCEDIKGLLACQVYDLPFPDVNEAVIILTEKPLTKTILIQDNSYIYGPFDYVDEIDPATNQHILHLKPISTPLNKIQQFHIGKIGIQKCIAYLSQNNHSHMTFLCNIKRIFENIDDTIDYITNDQIISTYGNRIAQNSEIRSFNKGTIAQIRKCYTSSQEFRTFPERFNRLFQNLEMAENWDNTRKDLMDSFLSIDKGREILKKYIDENKEEYFREEKQSFLKKLQEDKLNQQQAFNALVNKKEQVEADIRKMLRARELFQFNGGQISTITITTEEKNKIEQKLSSRRKELDTLTAEVKVLEEKHSRFKKIEDLKNEIDDLERERDRYRDRKRQMEEQVEDVAKKLRESNEVLTSRLVQLKPDVDALCGLKPKAVFSSLDYNVITRKISATESDEDTRENLINSVLDALNNRGRKTDYYTVANILTTIAQCQFTLFSGLPGTGKTSLAKILAASLGLQNRLLNIPVARGWTSSRDVLGFYNALSQSFIPSATGLFDLIRHLHYEMKEKIESAAPAIVLLDEFNLSQPEHYFSPFLEMADPESKRIILTGNPEEQHFQVPTYLRFLGTINQDESVQSLTPRLLDRAAIINFDDFEQDYDLSVVKSDTHKDLNISPITGNKFIDIFLPRSLEMTPDIERILQLIIETLRDDNPEFGTPVIVSYRKIKAIRSYHNVAGPMMYIESKYKALDYAVAQHILPLLNGYGQNFGNRLNTLLDNLPDEMERSHKLLRRIISTGNQNMFCYGANI